MTEFTDFLATHGLEREAELAWIEPVEVTQTFEGMWRSPLGTYVAELPDGHDDVLVAQRATITVRGSVLGDHPDGRRVATSDATQITLLARTVVTAWRFLDTPKNHTAVIPIG